MRIFSFIDRNGFITHIKGENFGDALFEYKHPVLSSIIGPIYAVIILLCVLWPISAIGKRGLIPAIVLIASIAVSFFLARYIKGSILFIWLQPVLLFILVLFIRYSFDANEKDTGVALMGAVVFAMIAIVLFALTGMVLAYNWGGVYLIAYFEVWILCVTSVSKCSFIIAYLLLFAVVVTVYIVIRSIKDPKYEINSIVIPGITILILTSIGYAHALLAQQYPDSTILLNDIETILTSSDEPGIVLFFVSVIKLFYSFPITRWIGGCMNWLALTLQSFVV